MAIPGFEFTTFRWLSAPYPSHSNHSTTTPFYFCVNITFQIGFKQLVMPLTTFPILRNSLPGHLSLSFFFFSLFYFFDLSFWIVINTHFYISLVTEIKVFIPIIKPCTHTHTHARARAHARTHASVSVSFLYILDLCKHDIC